MNPIVTAVSSSSGHFFSKEQVESIELLAGLGVQGDAHMGVTVKHRSRVAKDPTQPNLRQVHLIHSELLDELALDGYDIVPGQIGENITTQGIDLLSLPRDTKLRLGESAVVQITGLRNPCKQLDDHKSGLMQAVLDHDADGNLIRKAGIMAIVLAGGEVRSGDPIHVEFPPEPYIALERV